MFTAISIAVVIEAALVFAYMVLSRLLTSSPASDGSVAHVYLQYEAIFAFNMLESIIPPWVIGSLAGYRVFPLRICSG
jgi:hypothetical protein